MSNLSLCFLGPVRILRDAELLTGFKSNKVRALLVYLAMEPGRPHAREVLAGLLWPDVPDRVALSNLRYALSNLREVIGDRHVSPPFLKITRETIEFNTSADYLLDVAAFMNFSWFTEGFDTPDLREVKGMMDREIEFKGSKP